MKKLLLLSAIFLLAGAAFYSCQTKPTEGKSKILLFNYGGFGDTNMALLQLQIVKHKPGGRGYDSLTGLPGVTITVIETGKSEQTDSFGNCGFAFPKGIFSLRLSKDGYQPVLLKNYEATPDQHSGGRILMESGKTPQELVIPKEGIGL